MATFVKTKALTKILALKQRLKIIQGGSSAGKTIAILLILIDRAQREHGKLFSVVSESLPHLRRGAIRDFISILEGQKYFKEDNWNRTENIYNFETGSRIEFFGVESSDKVRGPRRDVLFMNEADNIPYETYTQLAIRTNEDIFIDYNPTRSFWVHEDIIPKHPHDFIVLTYRDNEALSPLIVEEIERRRANTSWFRVYGEGQIGEIEGRIFTGWQIIDEIPHEAKLVRRGLDFGYSNDPTAVVDIYRMDNAFIFDEIIYQKGMSNREIADTLKNFTSVLTVCDSAEPKSIDELKTYGLNVIPAVKGPGSVLQGIQLVQDKRVSVTKRSVNLIKEYRNYMWLTDRDGKVLNEPMDAFNHCMDAIRYGMPKEFYMTESKKQEMAFYKAIKEKRSKQQKNLSMA